MKAERKYVKEVMNKEVLGLIGDLAKHMGKGFMGQYVPSMPHGLTMALPMPMFSSEASALSFQKSTGPPMNGSGCGSVVIMLEHSTTRLSASAEPDACARTAAWFSTPVNSPPLKPPLRHRNDSK